jgi:hypothetical protein
MNTKIRLLELGRHLVYLLFFVSAIVYGLGFLVLWPAIWLWVLLRLVLAVFGLPAPKLSKPTEQLLLVPVKWGLD